MTRPLYYDNPTVLTIETDVIDSRPGSVRLLVSPFYPEGGGQLPDRGVLETTSGVHQVIGFEVDPAGGCWHLLDTTGEVHGNKGRHNRRIRLALEGVVDVR